MSEPHTHTAFISVPWREATAHVSMTIAMSVLLFLLPACSDEEGESHSLGRFVYYVVGDSYTERELHRHELDEGRDEIVFSGSIVSLSEVAANGTFLLETSTSTQWPLTYHLHACDRDGQMNTLPLPVSSDAAKEFHYEPMRDAGVSRPAAISYDGVHAAYFVWEAPASSPDTADWTLKLCVYDFSSGNNATANISSLLRQYYTAQASSFQPDRPQVYNSGISNDGSIHVTELLVMDMDGEGAIEYRWLLIGGTRKDMRVLEESYIGSSTSWRQVSFDGATGNFYVSRTDGSTIVHDCRGGSWSVAASGMSRGFLRLSARSGEYGEYNSNNQILTLERMSDGRREQIPFSREKAEAAFPDVKWFLGSDWSCALSPDGAWTVFIAAHMNERGLYAIRRDGRGFQRVARGNFILPPVVSDVVPYWQ